MATAREIKEMRAHIDESWGFAKAVCFWCGEILEAEDYTVSKAEIKLAKQMVDDGWKPISPEGYSDVGIGCSTCVRQHDPDREESEA
jgi:hypothetical protein